MNVMINGQSLETDDMKLIQSALRDARKAEAAERKENEKRAKLRQEANASADRRAHESGYWLLEAKASGDFGCIEFCGVDARFSPVTIERGFPDTRLRVEGSGGTVIVESYRMHYMGCIAGGSGIAMALFLRDETADTPVCYAIGTARALGYDDGQWSLKRCTGITLDDVPSAVFPEA
jgi:hypothetical protein